MNQPLNETREKTPTQWDVPLAASGPAEWQRVDLDDPQPERRPVDPVVVTGIDTDTDSISFDVDEIGTPVLVKASYFPNWRAEGADGPYRVAPNLMVVVPASEHVELHFGREPVEWIAYLLTLVGIAFTVVLARRPALRGDLDDDPPEPDPERHRPPGEPPAHLLSAP
jgi:hypothetical protein